MMSEELTLQEINSKLEELKRNLTLEMAKPKFNTNPNVASLQREILALESRRLTLEHLGDMNTPRKWKRPGSTY